MTTGSAPVGPDASAVVGEPSRALVVAAHGTADPAGQAVVVACATRAGELLAEQGIELVQPPPVGYVDVCGPTLDEVLDGLEHPVVVPFFLASGYHVRHDVPGAVAPVTGATVTPALGVAPEVLEALTDRIAEADPEPEAVLLVGAGSSVDAARDEVADVSARIGSQLGVATGTAFLSGPGARPEAELQRLREEGHTRVVLAAHLLSPGFFLDKARAVAAEHGAEVLATGPLGTHEALARLVARRYREALST